MMEKNPGFSHRRIDMIIGIAFVLLLLAIYFSPSAISSRYRDKMIQFPDAGYVAAEDSQQFAITATVTLESSDYKDDYYEDKMFINGKLHLEIYNIGTEPLLDFRWVGQIDPALHEYLTWGQGAVLNDPGIYTRYSMLLSNSFRPKHDMYHRDADLTLADYDPDTRRQPTRGFIYGGPFNLWHTVGEDELDVLLDRAAKPIRLKLLHEGGTELLLVKPVVDSTGVKR